MTQKNRKRKKAAHLLEKNVITALLAVVSSNVTEIKYIIVDDVVFLGFIYFALCLQIFFFFLIIKIKYNFNQMFSALTRTFATPFDDFCTFQSH